MSTSTASAVKPPPITFRAHYAQRLTREKIYRELVKAWKLRQGAQLKTAAAGAPGSPFGGLFPSDQPPSGPFDLPRDRRDHKFVGAPPPGAPAPPELKFCIVGAGVAGLFLAMMLSDLGLSYDLLEASDRIGGRMYTKHFSDIAHDYYDIGAMRYPMIPLMDKTFRLFEELETPLIPYYLNGPHTPEMYNDILGPPPNAQDFDHYRISVANQGVVPNWAVEAGVDNILEKAYERYKNALRENFETGFALLMAEADKFSTREYLRQFKFEGRDLDYHTIQWLETNDTSTGLYDQAFSESVIDSLDFDYGPNVEWRCIEGGTSLVAQAMVDKITTKPEARTVVKRIALRRDSETDTKMEVDLIGPQGAQTRKYDTVFNTTTLGSARRMDLRGAELHPAQKDALRVLHYDASCKVGIKFKTPWWITLCNIAQGGGASSDLPLRTCVYPSYNLHDGPNNPAVLLASYTWAQDAQRIGTLVQRNSPAGEDDLKELILRDLERLHSAHGITYEFLCEQYITHHAYDWYADPHMSGAFALFGPGQFSHLYPYLTRPAADGKLHFVGEAASAHHAWIVGSLHSAQRALTLALRKFGLGDLEDSLNEKWGPVPELEWGVDGTAHLQLILGCLKPEEMVEVDTKPVDEEE